ncbi:hypothetical protein AUJ69_04325 [Candidatus Woesearchaeota archaeon CG1_02_47_18]|nr:MAG: hypothetical protein AUJ69_04325 [Candidatus Woesearchaeota archaeon CG1_02_47_18]HII30091.1 hypothetical protein [Candidatus Woesearchaeota archaeon]
MKKSKKKGVRKGQAKLRAHKARPPEVKHLTKARGEDKGKGIIATFISSFRLRRSFIAIAGYDLAFYLFIYLAIVMWGAAIEHAMDRLSLSSLDQLTTLGPGSEALIAALLRATVIYSALIILLILAAGIILKGVVWKRLVGLPFRNFAFFNMAYLPAYIFTVFIAVYLFRSVLREVVHRAVNTPLFINTMGNPILRVFLAVLVFMPLVFFFINITNVFYARLKQARKLGWPSFVSDSLLKSVKLYPHYILMSVVFFIASLLVSPMERLPNPFLMIGSLLVLVVFGVWMKYYIVDLTRGL